MCRRPTRRWGTSCCDRCADTRLSRSSRTGDASTPVSCPDGAGVYSARLNQQESAMNKQIKGLINVCCSLGVALLLSTTAWALAEQEPNGARSAATPDSMTLEELDQVVIH